MLPTITQLKEVFEKLEVKLKCSGFPDVLIGWSIMIFSSGSALERLCLQEAPILGSMQASQVGDAASAPRPSTERLAENSQNDLPRQHHAPLKAEGPPLQSWRKRLSKASTNPGCFPCNECPPAGDIAKMIRAMAEIQRLGEAAFAIFKVPADFTVWIVGLVRWCMGTPPSIRPGSRTFSQTSDYRDTEMLQENSRIVVEILQLGSKLVNIQVFHRVDKADATLWESRSMTISSTAWAGMVSPKLYLQHRVRELQSLHRLYHITQFMIMLAQELGPQITSSSDLRGLYTMRPFPPANILVPLFKRLLNVRDAEPDRDFEASQLLPLWKNRTADEIGEAAGLFIELLALSVIENTYDEEPGFYIDTKSKNITSAFKRLRQEIVDFILQSSDGRIVASFYQLYQMAFTITGTDQSAGLTRPLISAKSGQVIYLSALETMTLEIYSPLRFRIFPGSFIYEGERYAYAEAEDLTILEDILDLRKVTAVDFADSPAREDYDAPHLKTKWFVTTQDNYVSLYFAPDIEANYSISPHLFVQAPEILIPCAPCPGNCTTTTALRGDIVYCQSIAAAFSESVPQIFRVLECSKKGNAYLFFTQAVITELWTSHIREETKRISSSTIILVQGQSCLIHACTTAEEVLRSIFVDDDLGTKRAIILS